MPWFKNIFGHSKAERRAADLYAAIGATARQVRFYEDMAVPDTLDGRFDMLMLMQSLVSFILMERGEAVIVRDMQEQMIRDMDRNLREIGVGDLSVGKQIKAMGAALIGRQAAYHAALRDDDLAAFEDAVQRNIYKIDAKNAEASACEGSDGSPQKALTADVYALFKAWRSVPTETLIKSLPGPQQAA